MNRKIILIISIIIIILLGVLIFFLINNNEDEKTTNNNKKDDVVNMETKSLVLYFSATGTTEKVAKIIADKTKSDIKEIIPKVKYTDEDLNYNNDSSRANKEQNDETARPEIESIDNLNKYDVIYLGYPIWWGDVPKVILTLLDSYNFDNKTIIPFCTSGSTGITQSMGTLKNYNSKVNWINGKRFDSSVSESEVEKWLMEIEVNKKMYIKINNKVLSVSLENNTSVEGLINQLKQNEIVVDMHDYESFEKVGDLGFDLPRNDTEITTTPGDVILYLGNQITSIL